MWCFSVILCNSKHKLCDVMLWQRSYKGYSLVGFETWKSKPIWNSLKKITIFLTFQGISCLPLWRVKKPDLLFDSFIFKHLYLLELYLSLRPASNVHNPQKYCRCLGLKTLNINTHMLDMFPAISKIFDNISTLIYGIKFCSHCIKVKFWLEHCLSWSWKSLLCCVQQLQWWKLFVEYHMSMGYCLCKKVVLWLHVP